MEVVQPRGYQRVVLSPSPVGDVRRDDGDTRGTCRFLQDPLTLVWTREFRTVSSLLDTGGRRWRVEGGGGGRRSRTIEDRGRAPGNVNDRVTDTGSQEREVNHPRKSGGSESSFQRTFSGGVWESDVVGGVRTEYYGRSRGRVGKGRSLAG